MLTEQFIKIIKKNNWEHDNIHLLLAVSGGLDSMCLANLLFINKIKFSIAHVNFNLRGEESTRDENFVKDWCNTNKITFFIQQVNTNEYAFKNNVTIQVAAREIRYAYFEELIKKHKFNYLFTAHHADDAIETVLMQFAKGTGIAGLHGITNYKNIKRPLLSFKRLELEQYMNENSFEYIEDSSNDEDKYLRNYFRHQIIPAFEEKIPSFKINMLANIERFSEIEVLMQDELKKIESKLITKTDSTTIVHINYLLKQKAQKTILYESLKKFDFTSNMLNDIYRLCKESETGKYLQSKTHQILKDRNNLLITKINSKEEFNTVIIEKDIKNIETKLGSFDFTTLETVEIVEDKNIEFFDYQKLEFPLLIRKWKATDYFYPLGLNKKKKINKFLSDLKINKNHKEDILIIESNQKIIWVVGFRISEKFKITNATKNILQIKFTT